MIARDDDQDSAWARDELNLTFRARLSLVSQRNHENLMRMESLRRREAVDFADVDDSNDDDMDGYEIEVKDIEIDVVPSTCTMCSGSGSTGFSKCAWCSS